MADERAGAGPASRSGQARGVLRGFTGFAIAVAGSLWLIFALWLLANDAPSSHGEPFRFTPPPEPPAAVATATPSADVLR